LVDGKKSSQFFLPQEYKFKAYKDSESAGVITFEVTDPALKIEMNAKVGVRLIDSTERESNTASVSRAR
jgi:hypothetical protein